jgi:hypothetical protein
MVLPGIPCISGLYTGFDSNSRRRFAQGSSRFRYNQQHSELLICAPKSLVSNGHCESVSWMDMAPAQHWHPCVLF